MQIESLNFITKCLLIARNLLIMNQNQSKLKNLIYFYLNQLLNYHQHCLSHYFLITYQQFNQSNRLLLSTLMQINLILDLDLLANSIILGFNHFEAVKFQLNYWLKYFIKVIDLLILLSDFNQISLKTLSFILIY